MNKIMYVIGIITGVALTYWQTPVVATACAIILLDGIWEVRQRRIKRIKKKF